MAKKLKDAIRHEYGAIVSFAGRGEMIPNKDCYCEIDPQKVDAWGIPVLRFHWRAHDHEIHQVKHMEDTFAVDHRNHGRKSDQPRARRPTAPSPRAERSSTKPAPCEWARIRRPPRSMDIASRTK